MRLTAQRWWLPSFPRGQSSNERVNGIAAGCPCAIPHLGSVAERLLEKVGEPEPHGGQLTTETKPLDDGVQAIVVRATADL
jgi:hypothetical protein